MGGRPVRHQKLDARGTGRVQNTNAKQWTNKCAQSTLTRNEIFFDYSDGIGSKIEKQMFIKTF